MAWVSVHDGVVDHPKTRKLAALLGCTRHEAIGILVSLWQWSLHNADRDGVIQNATEDDIADGIMYRPSSGMSAGQSDGHSMKSSRKLLNSLVDAGWIDVGNDDVFILHDWDEWQTEWFKYLDKLDADRRRKRDTRERARNVGGVSSGMSVGQSDGKAHGNPPVTITQPNHNQDINKTPPSPPLGEATARDNPNLQTKRFDEFWAMYPKKVAKGAALKSWGRIKPTKELFIKMLGTLSAAKASADWKRENGRFIPNPATWLNQGRWDDEIPLAGGEQRNEFNAGGMPGFRSALADDDDETE